MDGGGVMGKDKTALAIFTRGAQMLVEATTIQQNKELKDLAITAGEWARRKGMGEEAVSQARAFALDAECQMGRLLKESERDKGGRPKTGNRRAPVKENTPTLEELGITKKESSAAQKLLSLPKRIYQKVRSGSVSRAAAHRQLKKEAVSKNTQPLPKGKYRVLYADPPWSYNDKCDSGSVQAGGCEKHYPAMTLAQLEALPIPGMTTKDAVLFLWVTAPLLPDGLTLAASWGFKYKASFVWDKVKHNMGHYNSVRHEFLLICTKGSCTPDNVKLFDSVQSIDRTKKHSEKPEQFRKIIDTLYTNGRKIELFARTSAKGWKAWGNESEAV